MFARLALLAMVACGSGGAPPSAKATSMKGWELYSWQGSGDVAFALVPGTNRNKTAIEIKKQALSVDGVKQKLAGLAKGEEVFWQVGEVTTSDQFDLPERGGVRQQVVDEITRLGLKLEIIPPPPNVGTITMEAGGAIELHLRSLPPGPIAETVERYEPSDPKYAEMLAHVGGLAPGETKMLPPWPQ